MLLANKDHWIGEGKSSCPILVVCYTNHALDQFLEGIHTFCDANIVRVGGRSSNETLEPFLLKNIRKERRKEKSRSITLFRGEKDCIMHMKGSKYKIEKVSEKIKACTTKLISVDVHSVVSDRHSNSLQRRISYKCRDNSLAIWLGFTTEEEEAHQEDLENLPAKEKLTNIWKEMIINDVSPMTDDDVRCVKDVHALDLHERARLYKAWISQYMQQLEQELRNPFKDDIGSRTTRQKVMKRMKKGVLGLDSLTHFHLPPPYQHQIMQIGDMSLRNTKTDLVNSWLCLDFLPQSIALIRNIIENPPLELEDKDVDDDLEENRKLDDDDTDDFLQEYKTHGAEHIKPRESDWTRVDSSRKLEQKVRKLLNKPPKITDDDVALIDDVWEIPMETRKDLYRYWVRKYRTILKQEISQHEQEYQNAVMKYKEVLDLDSLDIMRTATVIGMTTTGAAKNRTLLQKVGPKIIIVEEAAEVLESHIVTTLNENCQHLILIGDHKQLRPNPTVYDLAKRYKLDISLFERLIKNKVPCVTLSEQHRMRPEISVLMRHKNLYPSLRDHHSVRLLADVLGVGGNVCFIDHKELEEQSGESTSYFNSYEAEFLASFCKYLIMQGYEAEQITVLSPYMGQVIKLRKTMPKHDFDGVRITAVDNYQGEENDIILLSLVRSDVKDEYFKKKNPIGFLGIENRVCVSLSRAKKGLFVIGNFEHLASYSDMWQYMVSTMRESNMIKKSITLRCQNHPDSAFEASTPEDFKKAPEGGCKLSCNFPLQCGHICQRFCHVRDKDHKFYKCFKPCGRTNACGHKCQRKCCQDCLPCLSKIEKIIPYCGHKSTMKCHLDPAKCVCLESCVRKLPCGHTCGLKCGDCRSNNKHRQRCEVKVEKRWPCGHTGITDCYLASKDIPCPQLCKERLRCSHTCSGTCGECLEGRIHRSCKETCNKLLLCGHRCSFPCSEICPPCTRRCEWICSHNIRCPNKCSQECWKCAENCTLKCPHMKCTMLCFEECENVTCNEPCKKELSCGHPCTGLCGEICPRICPVCEPKQLVNPDDRVIFLQDCQCHISVARLDYYMEQTVQATKGKVVPVFRCPECNKPIIKTIKRYTNYMKERRQLIADRYLALLGTPIQRKQESSRLRIRIQNLERLGLSLRDARTLEELELNTVEKEFGILHNIKRKTEIIEDTLKLIQEAKTVKGQNKTYVLAQVNKLKDLIMIKRKYVTSQFWDEAQKEIKTLRQSLHVTDVIKPCHSASKSASASRVESNILEASVTQLYKELHYLSPATFHKNVDGINISNDGGKKINKRTRDAVENDKTSDEIVDASDEILD